MSLILNELNAVESISFEINNISNSEVLIGVLEQTVDFEKVKAEDISFKVLRQKDLLPFCRKLQTVGLTIRGIFT